MVNLLAHILALQHGLLVCTRVWRSHLGKSVNILRVTFSSKLPSCTSKTFGSCRAILSRWCLATCLRAARSRALGAPLGRGALARRSPTAPAYRYGYGTPSAPRNTETRAPAFPSLVSRPMLRQGQSSRPPPSRERKSTCVAAERQPKASPRALRTHQGEVTRAGGRYSPSAAELSALGRWHGKGGQHIDHSTKVPSVDRKSLPPEVIARVDRHIVSLSPPPSHRTIFYQDHRVSRSAQVIAYLEARSAAALVPKPHPVPWPESCWRDRLQPARIPSRSRRCVHHGVARLYPRRLRDRCVALALRSARRHKVIDTCFGDNSEEEGNDRSDEYL